MSEFSSSLVLLSFTLSPQALQASIIPFESSCKLLFSKVSTRSSTLSSRERGPVSTDTILNCDNGLTTQMFKIQLRRLSLLTSSPSVTLPTTDTQTDKHWPDCDAVQAASHPADKQSCHHCQPSRLQPKH